MIVKFQVAGGSSAIVEGVGAGAPERVAAEMERLFGLPTTAEEIGKTPSERHQIIHAAVFGRRVD